MKARRDRLLRRAGLAAFVALCVIAVVAATAFGGGLLGPVQSAAPAAAPVDEPEGPPANIAADALPTPPATTQRMSVGDAEQEGNAGSGGITDQVDQSNGDQAISGDGRWVAFVSTASNLIPGTTQPPGRLYLRDRADGTTTAIPWFNAEPWPAGVTTAEPAISRDGGAVAFTVILAGTVGGIRGPTAPTPYVVVWDRATNALTLVSVNERGVAAPGYQPSISGDGRYVAYTAWAPPAATPPPDTTGPFLTNLQITGALNCGGGFEGQFCIFANECQPPHAASVSVTATDPSGISVVRLWYRYGFSDPYIGASLSQSGDTWTGVIGVGGVGANQIDYYWEAFDSLGNRSVLVWTSDRILRLEGCIF